MGRDACLYKQSQFTRRCRAQLYKQTQSGVPGREEACHREQTKPIGWRYRAGRGPVVQTNPIWGYPAVRSGVAVNKQSQTWAARGIWGTVSRVLYKQTQFGGTPPAGRRARGRLYKQTQFGRANCGKRSQSHRSARAPEGEVCKTNPISGYARWDEASGTRSNAPVSPVAGADHARQTHLARRPRPRRAECAKRTQLAGRGARRDEAPGKGERGTNAQNEANLALPRRDRVADGRKMQNEPNSVESMCRTKPIYFGGTEDHRQGQRL
jgi:hypothetical protein